MWRGSVSLLRPGGLSHSPGTSAQLRHAAAQERAGHECHMCVL